MTRSPARASTRLCTTQRTEAYVDTSAFIFFAARSDTWHPLFVRLCADPSKLEAAQAILRRFSDQQRTLVDAIGLHAMQTRGVRVCWSTDFHLGLTGVPLAIHTRGGSLSG